MTVFLVLHDEGISPSPLFFTEIRNHCTHNLIQHILSLDMKHPTTWSLSPQVCKWALETLLGITLQWTSILLFRREKKFCQLLHVIVIRIGFGCSSGSCVTFAKLNFRLKLLQSSLTLDFLCLFNPNLKPIHYPF